MPIRDPNGPERWRATFAAWRRSCLSALAFMLAFPLARACPMNDSWVFTVLISLGVAFLLVFALPFFVTRSGDQWLLNASGIGMSGLRVPWMPVAGHWQWKDVAGYRLSEQEVGGVVYEVLEVGLADGVILKAALSGRAKREAVEAFLSERGVQALETLR